jgi:anthranilate 1,2-dioxygenase large subunit
MDAVTDATHAPHGWPSEGNTHVPAWIYSDPKLFDAEMEAFFYGPTWNYVGLTCEIPRIGSFKRSWIGKKSVVVVRDHEGEIHVIENRCAHRSSPVCWKNKGEMESIVCPYHQWTYDLQGTLQSIPFRRGVQGQGGMPADFALEDHGLRRLKTTVRGGSIWASFADDPPDFAAYCGPEFLGHIDRLLNKKPLRLVGYSRQLIPCNWKLYFENSRDPYHATLLHTFFIRFGIYRADSPGIRTASTEGGRHMINHSANAGTQRSETAAQMTRFQNEFDLKDLETVTPRVEFLEYGTCGLQLFPSAFLQQHANALAIRHIIPRDPTSVELSWTFYGYEDDDESMRRLRLKHANLTGPAGYVSMDDSEVLALLQDTVSSYPEAVGVFEMGGRETEPQETMLTELGIRAFYGFYRQAMGL